MTADLMNLLRALIITVVGILILATLWPLFVFLLILMIGYWIYLGTKLKHLTPPVPPAENGQNPAQEDVIEAEYTERRD